MSPPESNISQPDQSPRSPAPESSNEARLTERQRRESDFYDTFASSNEVQEVPFDPIQGIETRPWNSYWFTYALIKQAFKAPGQKLLDFGCGRGVSAVRYAMIGYDVEGFDISPVSIKNAKALARRYGFEDRCRFSIQAAERLDYSDSSFDIVAGLDILHHVNIPESIREIHRVLKPGGMAVFREHTVAPVLDAIRNTRLVKWLVPNSKSFKRHITEDERKLDERDLATIRATFPSLRLHRFRLLTRFLFTRNEPLVMTVEKIDQRLFKSMPFLEPLGGGAVLAMTKEPPASPRQVSTAAERR